MRAELSFGAVLALGACDVVYGLEGRDDATTASGDLVAHFTMDSIAGKLVDDSGYGHVGLCQSACPTSTDGRIGGALHFNGTTVIGVTADASLETTSGFSIAGWYRVDGDVELGMCPFNKTHASDSNSWQLCFSSDRRVRFYSTDDGSTTTQLETEPVPANEFQHVVLWWDGTTKRIYVNGIPGPEVDAPTLFDRGIVSIGADFDVGIVTAPFFGDLDDLRIYKRALTSEEIVDLVTAN